MIARNKPPVCIGAGLNIHARGQNRRNAVRVHVSYRAFLRTRAFRPIYGKDRYREAIRLNAKAIGALLITYCILAKIPTPKAADKSIRVEAKSVVLTFRLHFPKAPRLASVPSSAQSWD